MECPLHKRVVLKPWQWAKDVCKRQKGKCARLVYDLHGNVVLVQRIYVCVRGRLCHKLMSATPDVMNTLPKVIEEYFPSLLTEKSGYTKTLADYTKAQLLQGVNFLKISEGIASLSIREFCRRKDLFAAAIGDCRSNSNEMGISISHFYQTSLFSYPSNDMNMFLKSFQARCHLYEENMGRSTAKVITCDHTFKVSRNIGVVRKEDKKFVSQYNQVFIVLNEEGEVLGWRLTKSTTFSEIEDLLQGVKQRLDSKQKALSMICVDDCCHVRNKYNQVFPGTEVKQYIFICSIHQKPVHSSIHPFVMCFSYVNLHLFMFHQSPLGNKLAKVNHRD